MDPEDRVITGFHCTPKVWHGYTLGILKCVEGIMLWSCKKRWCPVIAKKFLYIKNHIICPILNCMPVLKPQVFVKNGCYFFNLEINHAIMAQFRHFFSLCVQQNHAIKELYSRKKKIEEKK